MRILLVTETLMPGGAETFVIRLANALVEQHEVAIAVLHGELVNPALSARIDLRVRFERLRLPAERTLSRIDGLARRLRLDWSWLRAAQRRWLAALAGSFRPDVIHSHLLKADLAASEVRAMHPGTRHVITLHGDYAPFLHGQADPQMLGLARRASAILHRADGIAAVCREQLDWIAEYYPRAAAKASLIHNGYAPWRARRGAAPRPPAAPLVFGMVSRGVEQKGWAKAIAAFARLAPGSAELILVGEGPFLDQLRKAPLPDGVRFAGFSPDPTEWIDRFDVGLLPSEFPHESLPTVVMEYLFCGKPAIATDVGEIAAMLRAPQGLAGALLDFDGEQVSVDQLTAAMRSYLDDPALLRRHAARAPAAFAKFDMGQCAAAYARLYAEVAGSAPASSATSASH
jgi:glycosyltransferase involved in cell wall biosynthesis